MAIRTTQLVNKSVSAAGVSSLFTCPAGQRALIKYGSVFSAAAIPGSLQLYVVSPSGDTGVILRQGVAAQNTLYAVAGIYAVLNEGDILKCAIGSVTGGNTSVHVGGVVFDV